MLPDERPREKIWSKGVEALSTVELLAVLLRTGSKDRSSLEIARSLVETPEKMRRLSYLKPAELALEKGIGPAKAVTIIAALELGKRLFALSDEKTIINSTRDIVNLMKNKFSGKDKEVLAVLFLNANGQVNSIEMLGHGSLLSVSAEPRDIFHTAIMHRAAAVVLVHNHPFGDTTPSLEDDIFTKNIVEAGKVMCIPVIDHIIISEDSYYSFADNNKI